MSDPLQAPSPNQMEESICLDDESLLSPEVEQLPPESPLVQLDRPEPPLPDLDEEDEDQQEVNTGELNEGLGKSATVVTIDLGSQLSLDKTGEASQSEITTELVDNAAGASEDTTVENTEGKVLFEVGASAEPGETEQKTKSDDGGKSVTPSRGEEKSLSSYFGTEPSAGVDDDPFASVGHHEPKLDADESQELFQSLPPMEECEPTSGNVKAADAEDTNEDELVTKVRTESMGSSSVTQEAVPVGFEEIKGSEDLKFVGSTENVRQFFTDDDGGTDETGRSFFESFTADEGTGLDIDTAQQPAQPLKVDINSAHAVGTASVIVPETPPIPGQASPIPSPLHQPGNRSRTTSQSSTGVSPMHSSHSISEATKLPLETQISDNKGDTPHTTPSSSFQEGDDLFSSSLNMSDGDRRRDAWIPTEQTRAILVSMVTSAPGMYFPDPDQMTMPGVVIEDPQGDPVKELMVRFMGDAEASKRFTMTADNVSQDENGLKQLIKAECYRSAVDLTNKLLQTQGQGPGKVNCPSKHNTFSLQIWFTRIALLAKLRLHSQAETEVQAFGSLDKPDLYYDFYPDVYHGRRGSMVPFSFRVIHAELPQYLGKTQESLDRLYYIEAIVQKILFNLRSGLAEDGSMLQLSEESRKASKELWESREKRLLYSIGNCLLHTKDYSTAVTIFRELVNKDKDNQSALLCGIGRIYLQMGDMKSAQNYFDKVEECNKNKADDDDVKVSRAMNKGFIALGGNQFNEAREFFKEAVQIEPTNAVAVNNMAVCSLYMGKLKEALSTLENLVHEDPERFLQEGILFNLCTLYELESSRAINKKQALLDLVNKHKGNGFNVACLKMT